MDCKIFNKKIKKFIYDELNERDLERFLVHLDKCKNCREDLEILYIIEKSIVDIDDTENFSYDFNSRLKEFIAENEDRVYARIRLEFIRRLMYAVSAIISVAAAMVFFYK